MTLLPKHSYEFGESVYWNTFFKQRGDKAFEWYGEYPELCGLLHKYIKPKEKVLVVGCGNSQLSADMYDVGYREITNIDISEVAIRKMKKLHEKDRPDLVFLEMDALNMTFDSESFSAVLDKGTVDALMPDGKEETLETGRKLLNEVDRVLKFGGRFVCISLLQSHILSFLLEEFIGRGWMLRICRCHEAEEKALSEGSKRLMPVFVVVATKFKKMNNIQPVLELGLQKNGTLSREKTIDDMKKAIIEDQQMALICNGLRTSTIDNKEVEFDIFEPEEKEPKYHITVVESPKAKGTNMKYSAFIVPQGREVEWLFNSPEGRLELLGSSGCDRLAVVSIGRGLKADPTLAQVKADLNDIVLGMAPASLKPPIQFLTIGESLGSRKEVARGRSDFSGDYVVEDVTLSESDSFRRLYFLSKKDIVQSEAALKTVKTRKGRKVVVDHTRVCSEYIGWMAAATVETVSSDCAVAVVGLGGGSLASFLASVLNPSAKITAIEIDPEIAKIASTHFQLPSSVNVHLGDGLLWVNDSHSKGLLFDTVVFDVDCKDVTLGMSGPPIEFVEIDLLKEVSAIITEKGIFILNLICRDVGMRSDVWKRLKSVFPTVASIKSKQDVNEVVFCWNRQGVKASEVLALSVKRLKAIIEEKKLPKLDFLTTSNLSKYLEVE